MPTIAAYIRVELTDAQFERLVTLALKRGYLREHPDRAWTDRERKNAATYALGNIALMEAMRYE